MIIRPTYPTQRECDEFYGNPRNMFDASKPSLEWMNNNLVYVNVPFTLAFGDFQITRFMAHRKCASGFSLAFNNLYLMANKNYSTLNEWGVTKFGGCFNYRLMRGGNALSMHSYGCAIDLDPANNSLHDNTPRFAEFPQVIMAFKDAGAIWGGDWNGNNDTLDERKCDGMHFQFARLG